MCQAGCEDGALCTQPCCRQVCCTAIDSVPAAPVLPASECGLLLRSGGSLCPQSTDDTCTGLGPASHLKVILKVTSGLSLQRATSSNQDSLATIWSRCCSMASPVMGKG